MVENSASDGFFDQRAQGVFDLAYEGVPPWDIGRPQAEIVRLEEEGEIRGSVLDLGCGTGENALYLAREGHEVWGVDSAPRAIEKAREKAQQRGIDAIFLLGDALDLRQLDRAFDVVIDSGLFHVFSDAERRCYAESLASVLRPGGRYYMLCFSENEPGSWGPRRVTQDEIRATFGPGWRVDDIRPARFQANLPSGSAHAWLASITRLQPSA